MYPERAQTAHPHVQSSRRAEAICRNAAQQRRPPAVRVGEPVPALRRHHPCTIAPPSRTVCVDVAFFVVVYVLSFCHLLVLHFRCRFVRCMSAVTCIRLLFFSPRIIRAYPFPSPDPRTLHGPHITAPITRPHSPCRSSASTPNTPSPSFSPSYRHPTRRPPFTPIRCSLSSAPLCLYRPTRRPCADVQNVVYCAPLLLAVSRIIIGLFLSLFLSSTLLFMHPRMCTRHRILVMMKYMLGSRGSLWNHELCLSAWVGEVVDASGSLWRHNAARDILNRSCER